MITKDFIKDFIPPLKYSDTVARALQWMQSFHLVHMPVVDDVKYLGMVSENDLRKLKDLSQPLSQFDLKFDRVFIFESQYIFDALQFISNNGYSVVPVLNAAEKYIGLLTVVDVIDCFAQTKSVKTPGGIIILEVEAKDYSLAAIAQVIESNDGLILSSSINQTVNSDKYEVTIKINKLELTRILASFYRLNFKVIASYNQSDISNDLQDRYNAFMTYLNV
jgi:acetoin utilization protein AcuB